MQLPYDINFVQPVLPDKRQNVKLPQLVVSIQRDVVIWEIREFRLAAPCCFVGSNPTFDLECVLMICTRLVLQDDRLTPDATLRNKFIAARVGIQYLVAVILERISKRNYRTQFGQYLNVERV